MKTQQYRRMKSNYVAVTAVALPENIVNNGDSVCFVLVLAFMPEIFDSKDQWDHLLGQFCTTRSILS